ncbi:MAG: hypothetical protein IPK54_10185 [Dokdonella sp.]|uniref:hypothetical protein n=1 Tax=Dokdonella sp. TaxID=2291710 RepID=UPI0025B85747|nr:hypothetical protein [Dokdonella sp.]MBK8123900.1 hypothetical protein [Dokdonella sp.]
MREKPHIRFTRRINAGKEKLDRHTAGAYTWILQLYSPSVFRISLYQYGTEIGWADVTFKQIYRNKFNPIIDAINSLEDLIK